MKRLITAIAGLAVLLAAASTDAQETRWLTGLATQRAGNGVWVTFTLPVQPGASAKFRAFREGEEIGLGRVAWVAPVAPYEAYITDLKPDQRPTTMHTEYQALFRERAFAYTEYRHDLFPGCYVSAPAARGRGEPTSVDSLQSNLAALMEREDFRRVAQGARLEGPQAEVRIGQIVTGSAIAWQDPVTARLASRIAGLLRERSRIGGQVPGNWFPVELAKTEKKEGSQP